MDAIDRPLLRAGLTAVARHRFPDGGRPVWPELPTIQVWGRFPDGELTTRAHRLGRLALLGHCSATAAELDRALDATLVAGRIEALTELTGCYTALLATADRLLALTDIATQFPIYQRPAGADTVLCSERKPLTALREVDRLMAAAEIAGLSSDELLPGRSCFTDVASVSGARALEITHAGVREWTYPYLDQGEPLDLDRGRLALRAELDRAARAAIRATPRPTHDLSGGFDSSASAFRLSRYGELDVFTRHFPLADGGDLAPAQALAAANLALTHHTVKSGEAELPFADLPDALHSDAPNRSVEILGRLRLYTAALTQVNGGRHWTGRGGDALSHPSRAYLADLARAGRMGRMWREATVLARRRDDSPLRLVREAVSLARGGYDRALANLRHDLITGHPGSWTDDGIDGWRVLAPAGQWLRPSLRRELADALSPRSAEELGLTGVGIADRVALTQVRRAGRGLREWAELIDDAPPLHSLYVEGPVIRAALRTPAHERAHCYKALLRAAMADDRRWHPVIGSGDYTAELYRGFEKARAQLLALMENPRLADLGVIEPAPVRDAIKAAARGDAHPPGLVDVLAWELWLLGLA